MQQQRMAAAVVNALPRPAPWTSYPSDYAPHEGEVIIISGEANESWVFHLGDYWQDKVVKTASKPLANLGLKKTDEDTIFKGKLESKLGKSASRPAPWTSYPCDYAPHEGEVIIVSGEANESWVFHLGDYWQDKILSGKRQSWANLGLKKTDEDTVFKGKLESKLGKIASRPAPWTSYPCDSAPHEGEVNIISGEANESWVFLLGDYRVFRGNRTSKMGKTASKPWADVVLKNTGKDSVFKGKKESEMGKTASKRWANLALFLRRGATRVDRKTDKVEKLEFDASYYYM